MIALYDDALSVAIRKFLPSGFFLSSPSAGISSGDRSGLRGQHC